MRQVWKFSIVLRDEFEKDMPEGSEVLSVQTQDGDKCLGLLPWQIEAIEAGNHPDKRAIHAY